VFKVVTLVGTRPELIKLALVIRELDECCDQIFVHTGQNHDFELNEIFFRDLGLRKPDYFLGAAESNAAKTIARTIERFDEVLEKEAPDAMLLLGDTNSGLAVIAAKRRKIPIFHMEAGNRCFDLRVPEEINRRIIDHTSDVNLVYTEHARRYLLAEGLPPDRVIKTGSPMTEVLTAFMSQIDGSEIIESMGLEPDGYFVVSAHREENVDSPNRLKELVEILSRLAAEHNRRVIFSVHPRTRKRLEEFSIQLPKSIEFLKPLGFFDYVKLQKNSFCVLSDSGTLTEESSIIGFPAVMIRDAHERPEGMDEGIVIMTGLNLDRVLHAVTVLRMQKQRRFERPVDYQSENVAAKVARLVLSYTDFVNRTVWSKA
jgi:UDP-N-acetylglucosamine 2-epimerase